MRDYDRNSRQQKAIAHQNNKFKLFSILGNESIGVSHSRNIKIKEFENEQHKKAEEENLKFAHTMFPDYNILPLNLDCFSEDDLSIFKLYDLFNDSTKEILKLPLEKQKICFEYIDNNIDLQHFKSYLFYKKEIKNEEIFFPNNRYTYLGIEKLYLRKCKIDNLTERMFLTIRSSSFYSPNIKELYLSHNNLTNIDFLFKGLLCFYQLTKIDVSNNNILYLPSNLKNLVNLTDLNLKYNTNLLLGNSKTIKQIIDDPEFPKDIREKIKAKERVGKILYIQ
jgi:hypothetical protein